MAICSLWWFCYHTHLEIEDLEKQTQALCWALDIYKDKWETVPAWKEMRNRFGKITLLSNKCYDANKHRVFGEAQQRGSNPGQRWWEAVKAHWGKVTFSSMAPAGFSVSSPIPGTWVESVNEWTRWLLDLILKDCWICPSECIQMIFADEAWGMARPWASGTKVWAAALGRGQIPHSLTCDCPCDRDEWLYFLIPGQAKAGARRKRSSVPLRWSKNPKGQRESCTAKSRQSQK